VKSSIAKLLSVTDRSVYNWSQEKRPIISFLYKYFSEQDIEDYLKFGKIEKLELLNLSEPISLYEFESLSIILYKIEEYTRMNKKVNREGFLIKIYRTLRDFNGDPKDYVPFLSSYNMHTFESLRNVLYGSTLDDIIEFYENYLSGAEQKLLFEKKFYIMPTLKAMRKHNAHLKD